MAVNLDEGQFLAKSVALSFISAEIDRLFVDERIRVLIVDDDPGARDMVTVVLEHCGASVGAVGSADRVRALASGFDVHIRKPVEPRALAIAVAELVQSRTYAN